MALSDLQLLAVLETLVKQVKTGASPQAALGAVLMSHGRTVVPDLAKLAAPVNVQALAVKLGASAGGPFAPPVVGEAAALLRVGKYAAWLSDVGRLAAANLSG